MNLMRADHNRGGRSIASRFVMAGLLALAVVPALFFTVGFPAGALAAEEFVYGAVMPVTGPIPQHGDYFIRGSQMALDDIAAQGWIGGKKIRIIIEDGKNDPKISLAAAKKLISVDKVSILQTVGSGVMLALGPVTEKAHVVLVNTAAQNPKVRNIGPYTFSLVPLADRVIAKTVNHAIKNLKAKTGALLHVNNEYGRGVANAFKAMFEAQGGKIVDIEIHAQGDTDYSTPLTKIRFANPDLIFFVGHENEIGYATKKSRQMGIKIQWLTSPGVLTPLGIKIAGDAMNGVQAADYLFDPVGGSKAMIDFGSRFKKRYGVFPANPAARAYDALIIYAEALRSGARTADQIRDFYLSLNNFMGVSGPITFDKDGITLEGPVVNVVKNGKIIRLK